MICSELQLRILNVNMNDRSDQRLPNEWFAAYEGVRS